jgi:hypothetical protein
LGLSCIIYWNEKGAFYLDVLHTAIAEMTTNIEIVFEYSLCDDGFLDSAVGRKLFRKANTIIAKTSSRCGCVSPSARHSKRCTLPRTR